MSEDHQPASRWRLNPAERRRIGVCALLALMLIFGGATLVASATFRNIYFPAPAGTPYPSWERPAYPVLPDGIDNGKREATIDRCAETSSDSLFCQLNKTAVPIRSEHEKAIIRRMIAEDRSTNYCDTFQGECRPQHANISLEDASQLITYLKYRYLIPASANLERGRLEQVKTDVAWIGYLLRPIDLPLSSDYCCDDANMMFIAYAFSGEAAWRNRDYARRVFSLGVESLRFKSDVEASTDPSGYPDIDAYAAGIEANQDQCRRTAAQIFQRLALGDEGHLVKELAAYMALRSRFIDRIRGSGDCAKETAEPLSDNEVMALQSLVSRPGFVSDIQQMDAALLAAGAPNAP